MAKRRLSALAELTRLEADFNKQRMQVLRRAKDEAVGVVGSIVKQLEGFAANFPDVVASAVRHLADGAETATNRAPSRTAPANPIKATRKSKSQVKGATGAQIKSVLAAMEGKDGVAHHELVKTTKLGAGTVSAALKQLRADGKVASTGRGRGTTWKMAAK